VNNLKPTVFQIITYNLFTITYFALSPFQGLLSNLFEHRALPHAIAFALSGLN